MKKRDIRKRRQKRLMRAAQERADSKPPDGGADGPTVKVVRDTKGRQYIKAPDGSLRRVDKVAHGKLEWMSEGEL